MRIFELLEQTIQTVGPTGTSTGGTQSSSQTDQRKMDRQKMTSLLAPYGIKDPNEVADAEVALKTAVATPDQLEPGQQDLLGKLVTPMIKNQNFAATVKQITAPAPARQRSSIPQGTI